jgi:hypothetical protein
MATGIGTAALIIITEVIGIDQDPVVATHTDHGNIPIAVTLGIVEDGEGDLVVS